MNNLEITELKPNVIVGKNYDGHINLSAWKGFQSRNGPYGSKDCDKESDGTINVRIIGESVDHVHVLSKAQFNSIKFLKENSELIRDSLLNGLLKNYTNEKEKYESFMPEIKTISDYKKHLGVTFIHIMDSKKGHHAYVGFELGCAWDNEHGVGVMMHKDRIVKIGLAEESFNHWNCYYDNETADFEQAKWDGIHRTIKEQQKKWWKFWK